MSETQKIVIALPGSVRLLVPLVPVSTNNLSRYDAVHITARATRQYADEHNDLSMVAARSYAIKVGQFHLELGRMLSDYCFRYVAFPDRIEVVLETHASEEELRMEVEKLIEKYV